MGCRISGCLYRLCCALFEERGISTEMVSQPSLRLIDATVVKESKPLPTESPWWFEIDPPPIEEALTALGGIPLVVQAFGSLGLSQSVRPQVRVKERGHGNF